MGTKREKDSLAFLLNSGARLLNSAFERRISEAGLGLTPGETLKFEGGKVVNPDASVSPIVHQHDRHPHLEAPIHALWGGGLELRRRVRPKSAGQKFEKLKASLRRRMPELR